MKNIMRGLVASLVCMLSFVASASCDDSFAEKPPSQDQLVEAVKVVLKNDVDRFCLKPIASGNVMNDPRAMYLSFGESARISVSSVEIKQVGKYKGYWPIELRVTGTCELQYRSDFAQNSPMFSHWRGRAITSEIDTVLGIDAREDDFGRLQVRPRD